MDLSYNQKKFIKRNIRRLSLSDIAKTLHISEMQIKNYLKERWGEEKYNNFLEKHNGLNTENNKSFHQKLPFFLFIRKYWYVFIFLALIVIATYFNSLNNEFVSDDIDGILKNPQIGNLKTVFVNPLYAFYPFVHYIIYKIGGLQPIFFRSVNILWHLGSVWFIFIILFYLHGFIIAFFASSLFAVHPILLESVTWASGKPYSQAGIFLLASFLLYIFSNLNNKNKYTKILFSWLLFCIAVSTNPKSVPFPLVLLLYEYIYGNLRKNWKSLIPFFSVLFIGGIFFLSQIGGRIESLKAANYQDVGMDNPFVMIPIAITSYLQLIFWPDKLTLYHSELSFSITQYIVRAIGMVVYIGLSVYFYFKNKKVFFWFLFFPIMLLTVLTPLRIAWTVAERYVYVGSLGIFVIIAMFFEKLSRSNKIKPLVFLLFSFIIIVLMVRSIYRNIDWKNQDNLWIATGKTSPSDPKTHNNLGDVYARHNELEKSAEEFKKSIQINPRYAEAWHNLANIYFRMGKIELAIETYNKALSYNPNLWQSYQTLGVVYYNIGKFDIAEQNFKKAIELAPGNPDIHAYLGILYERMGKKEQAKQKFYDALQIDPKHQMSLNALKEATK